jgi:3-methyl-D-ornithine--L-lysine ligase PylC-like protein
MKKRLVRALVTGAGTGSSGNLVRALRMMSPKPHIVGVNNDRFVLKLSIADTNYLCPDPDSAEFCDALLKIIKRERINVVMATNDNVVKVLSDQRRRFPIDLLLPRRETIDLCQDKYALSIFLRRHNVPAPRSFELKSLGGLEKIFASFSNEGLLWCRARRGSRSLAAAPVASIEQARAWITQWRDLQRVKVSDFTLAEYLPGRHFIVQSLWHKGTMLRTQAVEVLSYFAAGNNPSGVFSMSSLAKTVAAPEAVRVALSAVEAVEKAPSGAFIVELREAANGVPSITEINAGRFPSGVTALLAVGKDNMVAAFAKTAIGENVAVAAEPYGSASEYYMVRDIDTNPAVFPAAELMTGPGRRAVLPPR